MKSLRKRSIHRSSRERWLVSYADFITLMFAFFVVLYASAEFNKQKAASVSVAIQGAFQELGIFPVSDVLTKPSGRATPAVPPTPRVQSEEIFMAQQLEAEREIEKQLQSALAQQIKDHKIVLRVTPRGLVVSLKEIGLFPSGEATLLPGAEATISDITEVLKQRSFDLRVEGHTDNMPIHTPHYQSNWELSTARATAVVKMLIEKEGLDPEAIAAAGYSEYHPVASNATAEGRKANRRIDLVISPRLAQ